LILGPAKLLLPLPHPLSVWNSEVQAQGGRAGLLEALGTEGAGVVKDDSH
jgi:hypothetical protein